MRFLRKLFKTEAIQPPRQPEHAVLVRFQYGEPNLEPLFALEDRLTDALAAAGVGEYDGHEIAVDLSDGTLYMYGPDADTLFAAARQVLAGTPFLAGARVTLRYGPPEAGVREAEVPLEVP